MLLVRAETKSRLRTSASGLGLFQVVRQRTPVPPIGPAPDQAMLGRDSDPGNSGPNCHHEVTSSP